MKKRFFYNHPIIGGLIALALVTIICNAIGDIAMIATAAVDLRADVLADKYPDVNPDDISATLTIFKTYLDKDLEQIVLYGAVALAALLCLPIFCWLNKKNGYLGLFRIQGKKLNDVKIFIAIFVVLDVATTLIYLFMQPNGFPQMPISFSMIVLALYAGINEEIIDRAIPAALMMRNKPTKRRLLATVLLTSVLFGFGHILNALTGQNLVTSILQMIFATGAGLFYASIYLRTGSIIITIVIHALHDFLVFMVSSLPDGGVSFIATDVLALLVNVAPFVFGVLMLLPKYHDDIIDTWKHIWPEKNMESHSVTVP